MRQAWSEDSRLFLMNSFAGQQTDLEQYFKFLLVTNEGNKAVEHCKYTEVTLSRRGSVDSEHLEVWWSVDMINKSINQSS